MSLAMPRELGRIAAPLRGRAVVVTGNAEASCREFAEALGRDGARIALIDVDAARARDSAARLSRAGVDVRAWGVDFADPSRVGALMVDLCEAYGGVDAIVNHTDGQAWPLASAARDTLAGEPARDGVSSPPSSMSSTSASSLWDRVVHRNLTAPLVMSRAVAAAMIARYQDLPEVLVRGRIVNLALDLPGVHPPRSALRHMATWGLLGLTQALQAELAPHRIQATAVLVGGSDCAWPSGTPLQSAPPQACACAATAVRWLLTLPIGARIPPVTVVPPSDAAPPPASKRPS